MAPKRQSSRRPTRITLDGRRGESRKIPCRKAMMSSGEQESSSLVLQIPSSLINAAMNGWIPRANPFHSVPMISLSMSQAYAHFPELRNGEERLELIFSASSALGAITLSLVDVRVVTPKSEDGDGASKRGS